MPKAAPDIEKSGALYQLFQSDPFFRLNSFHLFSSTISYFITPPFWSKKTVRGVTKLI
jgi:hypothetical protein